MSQAQKQDKKEIIGLYFHGVLEGLEPTPSGEIDGNKYGASLKLNFSTIENIEKKVGETTIKTVAKRNFKVSIDSTNEELPKLVEQWSAKLNQFQSVKLMPIKDGTYKMSI
jgi:hypothetical protein